MKGATILRKLATVLVTLTLSSLSILGQPQPLHAYAAIGQQYLPNVTKTFGGPGGWTTPIVVQNTGQTPTDVALSFFRFADGGPAATVKSPVLRPSQSWTLDPRSVRELPDNMQFSVVLQATSGAASAIVIEGSGDTWMSYSGIATGAATVYLPNVTRRLGGTGGWNTPFIVQNLGAAATTASVLFYRFADGVLEKRIDNIALQPGRAKDFVPWAIDGLTDDTQYAVVVQGATGSQLYAIVNEVQGGQAMSYEGLLGGAPVVYLPNVLKFLGGSDHWSTPFIVQNLGTAATTFSLEFYAFQSGALVSRVDGVALQPGRSFPVDVRFYPKSLPAGSYSVVVRGAQGAQLGAVVNQVDFGSGMAMAYDGVSQAQQTAFLPYIQRNNGAPRWFSPIIAQNLGSASGDITITILDGNGDVAAQKIFPVVAPGAAAVLDPRADRHLRDGVYSAVVQSTQSVAAVVNHAGTPGDHGMSYTSFAGPAMAVPTLPLTYTAGANNFRIAYANAADLYFDVAIPQADANRIASIVDTDTRQIESDFGREFAKLPRLFFFSSTAMYKLGLQSLAKYSQQQAADVTAPALYSPAAEAILVDWSELAQDPAVTAMRHELSHRMTHQITRDNPTLPAWLNEGLAVNEELTVPGTEWYATVNRYSAASMAVTNTLFSLEEMRSPITWGNRPGLAGSYQYRAATQAVQLLRDDIGRSGIVRILELMGGGATFDDAYAIVAKGPFATFAASFTQRVKALATSYPGIATVTGSPIGRGLTFVVYGFTPNTSITVEVLSSTHGGNFTTTLNAYGTLWDYLDDEFPPATYSISAVGANGSARVVAVKSN